MKPNLKCSPSSFLLQMNWKEILLTMSKTHAMACSRYMLAVIKACVGETSFVGSDKFVETFTIGISNL